MYPRIPRKVNKGEKLTADTVNQIIDCLRAQRITSIVGGTLQGTLNGTGIIIPPGGRRSGGGEEEDIRYPFRLQQAGTTGYTVDFGTVNTFEPTIGGVSLSAEDAPVLTAMETGFACVKANWTASPSDIVQDWYILSSVEIIHVPASSLAAGKTCPEDTATACYRALGKVVVQDGQITDILPAVTWSLQVMRYGVGPATASFLTYYWLN